LLIVPGALLFLLLAKNGALDNVAAACEGLRTQLAGHNIGGRFLFIRTITVTSAITVTSTIAITSPITVTSAVAIAGAITRAVAVTIAITSTIAGIGRVCRVGGVGGTATAYLYLGITRLRRRFGTKGAIPDIARRALVIGIRHRRIVGVLLITGRAGFLAGISGALNAVAGVAVDAKYA